MFERHLRTCKLALCHLYSMDILIRICNDAIKLQLLQHTDLMRKKAYLLPRELMILELSTPTSGEYESAAYNEDIHKEE